jgi:hypothetical protein
MSKAIKILNGGERRTLRMQTSNQNKNTNTNNQSPAFGTRVLSHFAGDVGCYKKLSLIGVSTVFMTKVLHEPSSCDSP